MQSQDQVHSQTDKITSNTSVIPHHIKNISVAWLLTLTASAFFLVWLRPSHRWVPRKEWYQQSQISALLKLNKRCTGVPRLVCAELSRAYRHLLEPTNFFWSAVLHLTGKLFAVSQGWQLTDEGWHRMLSVMTAIDAGCKDVLHDLDYCGKLCMYHNHDLRRYLKRVLHSRYDDHTVQWQSHYKHYGINDQIHFIRSLKVSSVLS